MSNLTPGLIVLDKGLNLQTPKITAPEGSVLDTLNYEQVDFQGQKRIDGFVRYDGKLGSYTDDYYISNIVAATSTVYSDADDNVIGIVVGQRVGNAILAIIDYNKLPAGVWGKDTDSVQVHYDNLLVFNALLRARTGGLPGPIAGLHWFRDRLYAVASLTTITIDPEVGTALAPNDILALDTYTATVLKVVGNVVTLATDDPTPWLVVGEELRLNGILAGVTGGVESSTVASFFESRTELQSEDEDDTPLNAGWRFVHQGWIVPFENGVSLYGSLPSLNQNIQGLGVQGPTSTAGNNGRPLLLTQGITISGEKAQVNGWKSSQTPNSYALNPSDVWEDDAIYTYADAYISWNGTTGQVIAPGITTSLLDQNSATNTIIVEGV